MDRRENRNEKKKKKKRNWLVWMQSSLSETLHPNIHDILDSSFICVNGS